MRRELQLPIYSLHREDIHQPEVVSGKGLWAMIARLKARFQRFDSLDIRENTPLYASSAYAAYASRQRAGRAR